MTEMLAEQEAAHEEMVAGLVVAKSLAKAGVPIFMAYPALDKHGNWLPTGGTGGSGYILPTDWQKTEPDPHALDLWQPGMAICAVMGHTVDAVDIDPRHGGDKTAEGWKTANMYPTSYGRQRTPSGGYHELVYPLGVGSKDATAAGIDVKGGNPDGSGRGFIFIAPTRKAVKGDDGKVKLHENGKPVIGRYEWEVPPHLEDLDENDDTGLTVASLIENSRPGKSGGKAKTGGRSRNGKSRPRKSTPAVDAPVYAAMDEFDKRRVVSYIAATTRNMKAELEAAASWPVEHRDDQGRGWQKLVSDVAYRVGGFARASWTPLTLDDGKEIFSDMVPAVIARDVPLEREWSAQCHRAEPAPLPWPEVEGDFRSLFDHNDTPEADAGRAPVDTTQDDSFFSASPTLKRIRLAAHSRMLEPWAVLGAGLARVVAEVPPWVVLPPTVGSVASMNVAVLLVADSSGGKSTAVACARELLPGATAKTVGAPTGEGIVQTFLRWDKDQHANVLVDDPRAMMFVDEIGQVAAVTSRSGSTFGSTFRSAISGAALGNQNAAADRRRYLPAHSYRFTAACGAQPHLTDVLLNQTEVDAGTPQRWLFVRAKPAALPDSEPEWPGPLNWTAPVFERPAGLLFAEVGLPESVTAYVKAQRRLALLGDAKAVDGHLVLTRLKVATALAWLHGERDVSEQWWDLAAIVIEESCAVRDDCFALLARKRAEEDRAKGKSDARRAAGAREAVAAECDKYAQLLADTVAKGSHSNAKHQPDAGCTGRCLTHALRNHRAADKDAALKRAVDLGWVEERDGRYFRGESWPSAS